MPLLKNHFYHELQPDKAKGEAAKAQAAQSLATLLEMAQSDLPSLLKHLHSTQDRICFVG